MIDGVSVLGASAIYADSPRCSETCFSFGVVCEIVNQVKKCCDVCVVLAGSVTVKAIGRMKESDDDEEASRLYDRVLRQARSCQRRLRLASPVLLVWVVVIWSRVKSDVDLRNGLGHDLGRRDRLYLAGRALARAHGLIRVPALGRRLLVDVLPHVPCLLRSANRQPVPSSRIHAAL